MKEGKLGVAAHAEEAAEYESPRGVRGRVECGERVLDCELGGRRQTGELGEEGFSVLIGLVRRLRCC